MSDNDTLLTLPFLRCPVCGQCLTSTPSGVNCPNNHQFDRARQGYINLLQGHKKRSRNPGDDKLMVDARARFLTEGYYSEVANSLISEISSITKHTKTPVIIDAGCGEGYYTHCIRQCLPHSQMIGFDISKPAIQACCHRDKTIQWLVASVNDIPVADCRADIIISIFSRCDWDEFRRLLKPKGVILVLGPGPDHLRELREVIYEQVRPYPEDKMVSNLPDDFLLQKTQAVQGNMELLNSESIMALLSMTPHYWRVRPEKKQRLQSLNKLACHYDMRLSCIRVV